MRVTATRATKRCVVGWAAAAAVATVTTAAALVGDAAASRGEERVFRAINDTSPVWWPLVWPTMQLGNRAAPIVVAAILALRTRRWRPPVTVLVAGYGAWAASSVLKGLVGRGRPDVLLAEVALREPTEGLGFVSGHAAVAAAIAVAVWPHLGRRGRLASVVLAALVGVGRVYAGAHMPLDVVGGWAIGALIGIAATSGLSHAPAPGRSAAA